jgi:hypothetical protein
MWPNLGQHPEDAMPDYTDPHYLISELICVILFIALCSLGIWTW